VLYGTPAGLTGTGSQLFTQNSTGVGSTAEGGDGFGQALAGGDFDNDGFADLSVGAPFESSSLIAVGLVNVLAGSAAGLTGTGSQTFTQNTPGVGSTAEEDDLFGFALAASGAEGPTAVQSPAPPSATSLCNLLPATPASRWISDACCAPSQARRNGTNVWPPLAVAGIGDASLIVAEFAGLSPNATLFTLPGCGHFPWLEQPNQCNRDSWPYAPGGISRRLRRSRRA
jgi:pimeloyl-ACP methyl ester carboxylesterase